MTTARQMPTVEFHPETGSARPWELWNGSHTRCLGSFKTEAAATKKQKIFIAAIEATEQAK